MKVNFLCYVFLAFVLSSFSGCREEMDFTKLPPETQEGKNTFGCYVDGKMFFGGYFSPWMHYPLVAEYQRNLNRLVIATFGKIDEEYGGYMLLLVLDPIVDTIQPLSIADYETPDKWGSGGYCYRYRVENSGEIYFTKLDTVNKIVSGRFNFNGICSGISPKEIDSTILSPISDGRFDLILNVVDYFD